jgi:hypothetical protein
MAAGGLVIDEQSGSANISSSKSQQVTGVGYIHFIDAVRPQDALCITGELRPRKSSAEAVLNKAKHYVMVSLLSCLWPTVAHEAATWAALAAGAAAKRPVAIPKSHDVI